MAVILPSVVRIDPPSGNADGGDIVTITGTGFTHADTVVFGNVAVSIPPPPTDTQVIVLSPDINLSSLRARQDVHIVVRTAAGASAKTNADVFVCLGTPHWTPLHTVLLFGIVLLIGIAGSLIPFSVATSSSFSSGFSPAGPTRVFAWLVILVLMAFFLVVAGHGVTRRIPGLLIDSRNKMSLSRLQLVLWTIVIFSAMLAAWLSNLAFGEVEPLRLVIPQEVWTALGISTASLVGSPLLLSTKTGAGNTPDPGDAQDTKTRVAIQENVPAYDLNNNGLILTKQHPAYAGWSDLFKGEETGNGDYLDIAKVQLFFITLILVFSYALALDADLVALARGIHDFPKLDSSAVTLLGISHAGYLTNKAIPHSATQ